MTILNSQFIYHRKELAEEYCRILSGRSPVNNATSGLFLAAPRRTGKSTFLRTLNRMNDTIDGARVTGEINYEGVNINENKVNVFEVRKQIGMVFQRPNPFPKSIYEVQGSLS